MTNTNVSSQRGRGRPTKPELPPTDVVLEVRTKLGLTQEEFAREMNCTTSAIRKMESDRRLPGSQALKQNFVKVAARAGIKAE